MALTLPPGELLRVRGPCSVGELLGLVGLTRDDVASFGRGRLLFADGREAWRAGPSWIVGASADLRTLFGDGPD